MKMRQFKHTKLALMSYALFGPLGPSGTVTPMVKAFREGMRQVQAQVVLDMPSISQEVAGGPVTVHEVYKVRRVKDDEIVLETEDRGLALQLITKHAKQKKAKLYATYAGEAVLFSEEEMA